MTTIWGAGLLLEAALIAPLFVLLVRPEPPIVAQLRGEDLNVQRIVLAESAAGNHATVRARARAHEDSFYTVLHWPPTKALLQGGGRVVALPMSLWWIPALYVGFVPRALVTVTGAWLVARRGVDDASTG